MEHKTTRIGIRCTTDEKAEMQKLAHENYKTLSKYMRDLVFNDNNARN